MPRVKSVPPIEKIKIDKFVPSKKQQLQDQHHQQNRLNQDLSAQQRCRDLEENEAKEKMMDKEEMCGSSIEKSERSKVTQMQTSVLTFNAVEEPEVEAEKVETETVNIKPIAVDEKDMIEKSEGEFTLSTFFRHFYILGKT